MIRKFLVTTVLLPLAVLAENPHTLRVDYFHTGSVDNEIFSLDRVVLEPLAFPGNLEKPIDGTLRGKYAFEVIDPTTGEVAWSRSFSSIYGEWETTGEARQMNRTFHESVRLPDQPGPFDLVMKKRNPDNQFREIWRIRIDPDDYLVHRETAAFEDQVIAIEHNGDPATKVDVLLLGDGYTIGETDEFIARAKELTDLLFRTSPFMERRTDFNVWALAPPASQPGVSRPSTGVYRDSPVGATYDAFRSERYVLTYSNSEWRRIASSAPYDFVEILTNSDTYGGGGIYGLFSTAAANSEWAGYLFIHEFAHHFAGLADEYYTSSVAYEAPEIIREPYEPNVTALTDPDNVKWKHLVESDTPLPTPWPKAAYEEHSLAYQAERARMREADVSEAEMNKLFAENQRIVDGMFSAAPHRNAVGAFEGANYLATGYYRSEMNCIMFTRTEDFCRVCAAAIEAVIDEYTR
jgi:hypothetical protein